jgi:hypothetical protein
MTWRTGPRLAAAFALWGALSAGTARAADKAACARAYEDGQKQRAAGSLRAARDLFLVCAEPDCPDATKKDCVAWVAEVEATMPTVVLSATGESGEDLVDVRVSLDGQPFSDSVDGKAKMIDPGKHVLRFERAGAPPIEREIVVKQGEKDRKVEASWSAEADGTARPFPISPGTWVLGGLGLAGITVFAVAGGVALSEKSDAEQTCAPSCSDAVVDSIRAKMIVADVSLAVGVASLGAAVVLGLTSVLSKDGSERAVGLGMVPAGPGASAVLFGRF